MRYFNTSGPNIPAKHYTLHRPVILAEGAKKVYDERYFTIWAPRQTGKSTYFRLLADEIERQGYKAACINFENFKEENISAFLNHLHFHLKTFWGVDFSGLSLGETFIEIAKVNDRKWVLIIDEVEGINSDFFGQFLHSIPFVTHIIREPTTL
jgi:hypothetical protein